MPDNILLHPWFPKTQPPMSGGSRSGEWLSRSQQDLATLADTLVYEVANGRVNSLPSPWSRALQFRQAVINDSYPTRDDLLEELFGCFATVALWQMLGLNLTAHRVALADYIGANDQAVGPFARSLDGSKPSSDNTLYKLVGGGNPWDVVYVLIVDNQFVIGFTSPATLLCPAVHLPAPIPGMNWTAGGRFSEPTKFLGAQQKQAFANWLAHIQQEIINDPDRNSQIVLSQLNEVLQGFIGKLTGGNIENPILSNRQVAGLPTSPHAISLLARAAMGGDNAPSQATLKLGERKQRSQTPARPVILLDPQMPIHLGLPPNGIVLYKTATLETVGSDKQRLVALYGEEIDVLTPDDVFLPEKELYLLLGEAALDNSWLSHRLEGKALINGIQVTPLLPLRERVRDLFSSAELARQCSLRVVDNGAGMGIEIMLLLPLEGNPKPYPITRTFPLLEENLIDEALPVITLWPYINDQAWKYYVIFSEDRGAGLSVDGFTDYKLAKGREGQENVKYFISERFPDLIKINECGQYRGLIPVNPPPLPSNNASSWRVGIDFGTSFTNYFIDEGAGPSRKALETRVISLTKTQDNYRALKLDKFFIPETSSIDGSLPPILTALNTFGWIYSRGDVPDLFHQARVQWPNLKTLRGPNIHTGFKWLDLQYQPPFLKELALLISCNAMASGATTLEWAISYPSAFSPNKSRLYLNLWEDLCHELVSLTGQQHTIIVEGGERGLQTEAIAFASYFGNHLNCQMVHTACLDVGGGTTDISIWQDNSLLHQVSVPFAGRDIFTKLIQAKPSFIRFLFLSQKAISSSHDIDETELRLSPNFNSYLDLQIRLLKDKALKQKLRTLRSDNDRQLLEFFSLIAIGFGGIYHYLGLILKALAKEGRLQKRVVMPVYMGGNGARFLHWLDETGSFYKGSDSDKLLGNIQLKSSGFEQTGRPASTTLSDAFKDETACGLISKSSNLKGDFDPRDEPMFAGEKLVINGKVFEALDRVCLPHEMSTIESFDLGGLQELKHFVENYDETINSLRINTLLPIRKIFSSGTLWDDIATEVGEIRSDPKRIGKEISDIEPEPGFIIALRALCKVLVQNWKEKF